MKNLTVANGLVVEVEYVLCEDGGDQEVLEKCPAEDAFGFTIGEGHVLEAFEQALIGKKVGEPFSVSIPCENAYGSFSAEAIVRLPKEIFEVDGKFDAEAISPGEVLPMSDNDGNELYGIVLEVTDTDVEMDFNHPFADLDLLFEGTICDIRED